MRFFAPARRARLTRLVLCVSLLAQAPLPVVAGASAGGGAGKGAPPSIRGAGRQAAEAAELPDLNEARNRPRHEPKAVPPVPSTRRRCPPRNPRCNDDVDGAARPDATPAPTPHGVAQADEGRDLLACLAARSFLAMMTAALDGGRPLMDLDALDFYAEGDLRLLRRKCEDIQARRPRP